MIHEATTAVSPVPLLGNGKDRITSWPTIAAALAIVVFGVVGSISLYLIYPGTPSRSRFMTFDGFITLPRGGLLNVLDYMTISGHSLFVTSESSGALYKVALDLDRVTASLVSVMPGSGAGHGVALLPETKIVFMTRSEVDTVDVFDSEPLQLLTSIPVAEDADAILYVPAQKLIYVANGDPKLATLIDPVKRVITGAIQLPGKPEFVALDPETGLLYQNLQDLNTVAAVDVGKRSIVGQWSLAPCEGPSGMAIDPVQRRLFAVCAVNAKLVVFDLETHRIVASLTIGGGPDSVAFDPTIHRIYAAGKAGKLTCD